MFTGLRTARSLWQGPARDNVLRSFQHHIRIQGQSTASRARQLSTKSSVSSASSITRKTPVLPLWQINLVRRTRGRRYNSTNQSPNPTPHLGSPKPALGLSARLKELSKRYGWAAFGVYMGLSVLDFPFCFLAVRMLGAERVAQAEHWVVDKFWTLVAMVAPSMAPEGREISEEEIAEKRANATLWTQLLLAYGVHKSLIFFRVPLAAAVTPKVVKFLRARGWNIGKPKLA